MKVYEKPIISVDEGMTEGVYAASGASQGGVNVSSGKVVADWVGSGQASFTLDLSGVESSQLTVVLTFSTDISSAWGGGASVSYSGNTATLYWYSAPSSAEITVQANGTISNLKCVGSSYSNAN